MANLIYKSQLCKKVEPKNCGFNFGFCVILSVAMKIKVIASVTMNILQHQMIASLTKFASEVLD